MSRDVAGAMDTLSRVSIVRDANVHTSIPKSKLAKAVNVVAQDFLQQ